MRSASQPSEADALEAREELLREAATMGLYVSVVEEVHLFEFTRSPQRIWPPTGVR